MHCSVIASHNVRSSLPERGALAVLGTLCASIYGMVHGSVASMKFDRQRGSVPRVPSSSNPLEVGEWLTGRQAAAGLPVPR